MVGKHDYNLEGYSNPAHFFIPGAFESVRFITKLAHSKESNMFKNNALMDCAYGNVTMVWNGGRAVSDLYLDRVSLEEIHNAYAETGTTVRFVCTNDNLTEHDLYDRYANFVLDVFGDVPFEIVVKDPRLEDYLRSKYKNAEFISSTTKHIRDTESIITELKKDYKYVCLDYSLTRNGQVLKSIPMELRGKVELLVNERCMIGCPMRKLHYKKMSEAQLMFSRADDFMENCPVEKSKGCDYDSNYISNYQLEHFLKLGYNHFKLEGRAKRTPYLAAEIMPYIIHPDSYIKYMSNIDEGYNNFKYI